MFLSSKLLFMKRFEILFAILLMVLLTSCSKKLTYFTDDIVNANRWSPDEIEKIQFYVSEDIRLIRSREIAKSEIDDGKIKIRDNQKVDEVIIKKGTPGVVVFSPKDDRIAISFDEDSDKYLMFGPNEKASGRYVLLAKKWKRRGGTISYGGEEYRTGSDSAYAALLVDISKANKVSRSSEVADGRRVR